MKIKPTFGILFFTSGWFRDIGLQSKYSNLTKSVSLIAKEIFLQLSINLNIIASKIIYNSTNAKKEAEKMALKDIDGLIIVPLTWCEDNIIRTALKVFPKIPILLCTFLPYKKLNEYIPFNDMLKGSGTVASLQLSGMLKREDYKFESFIGWYKDTNLYKNIVNAALSIGIKKALINARCGVMPYRCNQMSTTYVDEFALRKLYGIELIYIELSQLKEIVKNISNIEIDEYKSWLYKQNIIIEVSEKDLLEGIKYSIALLKLAKDYNIQILAMNDVIDSMHNQFGLRPALTNPHLIKVSTVVAMEADIAAGITMYILHLFTGNSPFYTEIFTADLDNNTLLMGHAGYHDITHAEKKYPIHIVNDIEYKNSDKYAGACIYFRFQSGPITAINSVYNGSKLQWTIFEGFSIDLPPLLEGNAHLICKPDLRIEKIFNFSINHGVSQHWIIVPGHISHQLRILSYWLNIDTYIFENST